MTRATPRARQVASGVGQAHEILYVWDVEGRRYIDFAGGIAVLNTGHRHPKIIDAVQPRLELYTHTCFQVVAYEPYDAWSDHFRAEKAIHHSLADISPSTIAQSPFPDSLSEKRRQFEQLLPSFGCSRYEKSAFAASAPKARSGARLMPASAGTIIQRVAATSARRRKRR